MPNDRSTADTELSSDLTFASSFLPEGFHSFTKNCSRSRSSVWTPLLSGLSDSSFHAITQNFPFKFGKDRQHIGECPS